MSTFIRRMLQAGAPTEEVVSELKGEMAELRALILEIAKPPVRATYSWGSCGKVISGLVSAGRSVLRREVPVFAVLGAVGLAYAGYKVYKYSGSSREEAPRSTENKLVALDSVRTMHNQELVPESIRAGSVETPSVRPKFQAVVGTLDADGTFTTLGCCVRMDDVLLIPEHVFALAGRELAIQGAQGILRMPDAVYEEIDVDIGFLSLTEREFSSIGISKVSVETVIPTAGALVQISGVRDMGTMGPLYIDMQTFGRVIYEATTKAGYSGAAYRSTKLYGIHTNGGQINAGWSAAYLKCALQIIKNQRVTTPESSEAWLRKLFEAGVAIRGKRYQDQYMLQINADFHLIEDTVAHAVLGDQIFSSNGRWMLKNKRFSYDDADVEFEALPHSGEARSSTSGASSSLIRSPVSVGVSARPSKLSKKKSMKLRANRESLDNQGIVIQEMMDEVQLN